MTAILAVLLLAAQDKPDPVEIVRRMAANLEKSAKEQQLYVHERRVWSVHVRGRAALQERRSYTVVPGAHGLGKELNGYEGACHKGELTDRYQKPGFECQGLERDHSLVAGLIDDLLDDEKSRDGVPYWLFPLRTEHLKYFTFAWQGESVLKNGRRVHTVAFEPAKRVSCGDLASDRDCRSRLWKGTVWVDAEEYQPARISTVPFADIPASRRRASGMRLKRAAFSVDYQRVAENAWFPVAYCIVLWNGLNLVRVSFESQDFRRGVVASSIEYVESSIQYHLP